MELYFKTENLLFDNFKHRYSDHLQIMDKIARKSERFRDTGSLLKGRNIRKELAGNR